MILSTCKAGDKIILPRNVHKSAINALVLCGAIPIYIEMSVDPKIGIALGLENDRVAQAIRTIQMQGYLINNPTYYGICSDLKGLTEMAHEAGMMVLVDEAHGRICILLINFQFLWMLALIWRQSLCISLVGV